MEKLDTDRKELGEENWIEIGIESAWDGICLWEKEKSHYLYLQ